MEPFKQSEKISLWLSLKKIFQRHFGVNEFVIIIYSFAKMRSSTKTLILEVIFCLCHHRTFVQIQVHFQYKFHKCESAYRNFKKKNRNCKYNS